MTRTVAICFLVFLCSACGSSNSVASFQEPKSGTLVTIELEATQPHLAEYNRTLIIKKDGQEPTRYVLSIDTGGYAAANLYMCSSGGLMLDNFSERIVIDTSSGSVRTGKCLDSPVYLGVFDGGGSEPWSFFPASQRTERRLLRRGG